MAAHFTSNDWEDLNLNFNDKLSYFQDDEDYTDNDDFYRNLFPHSLPIVNGAPASKPQIHLAHLFGGEINFQFGNYYLDIFFPEDFIYCEYDGSGHDLAVQQGKISREMFQAHERIRREFLEAHGLREFRIKNPHDKPLPSDNRLLSAKKYVFNYFSLDNCQWVVMDLDQGMIFTELGKIRLCDIY